MTYFDAFVLGLIQGLTEFLPVSSSGHLALFRHLTGRQAEGSLAFDVLLHFATLLAVVIAFRQAIYKSLTEDRESLLKVGVATAFLGLVLLPVGSGLKLKDWVEGAGQSPAWLAFGFFITAVFLSLMTWSLSRRPAPEAVTEEDTGAEPSPFTYVDAAIIGVFQLFAVFPGISRSGSTITAGLLRQADREQAFNFAFLLSIPAVLGAVVFKAKDIVSLSEMQWPAVTLGFVTALISGLASIACLRWLLAKDRFWIFIPYLLVCSALSLSRLAV